MGNDPRDGRPHVKMCGGDGTAACVWIKSRQPSLLRYKLNISQKKECPGAKCARTRCHQHFLETCKARHPARGLGRWWQRPCGPASGGGPAWDSNAGKSDCSYLLRLQQRKKALPVLLTQALTFAHLLQCSLNLFLRPCFPASARSAAPLVRL